MTDDDNPEHRSSSSSKANHEKTRNGSARRRFPIVGIGASAGGLDALRTLFQATPANTGMGFVVTQHLDAGHESLLADLLSKFTAMRVVQVVNGMSVEPNCIYVIPPNTYMTISDGILLLKPPSDARGMRMPIDRFLLSLARDMQERAIGIILSGTGTDGTLGVREIKANTGLVLVQDPETAQYDGMPRSAIATGHADAVLPLESMPEVLLNYIRHAYNEHEVQISTDREGGYDPLTAILVLLLAKTGHDFRCYKKGTLVRRIHRRMGITGAEHLENYLGLLRERDDEIRALSKDLFIGVTSFFRETDAWSAIAEQVVAPIVAGYSGDSPVRVWVPGCATGEEAYTLTILFAEAFEQARKNLKLLVFATDVDTDAIQIGRAGLYQDDIAENLSPERLNRFFTKEGNGYRVNKSLRDQVVFTPQNLIADPPFSKLDLISCRNLLIYLESRLQEKILRLFHFALKPDGFLLLGSSENLGSQQREFRTLSKKWRIFQPDGPSQLGLMEMPMSREAERSVPRFLARGLGRREPSLADMAQQALVETFAPASVLVTRRYQVLYVYGDTSDYLAHPPGELTDDLLAMTRSELRLKTRAALHLANGENRQVTMHGAKVKRGDTILPVTITATPLQRPPLVAGLLLVSFHHEPSETRQTPELGLIQGPEAEMVRQLEDELKTTREELQSTIEELETSNEELKASNEEVMSMNEELQSSNEELETSREELQSLNEELTTVNNQLQNKIVEVETTNNDLSNLLSSTNIATLFLDRELCIKRFTHATTRLMNLIPADVGRPVADIAHKYANDSLSDDCSKVLEELRPVEREIQSEGDECYIRRVQPYRTHDNRIEGTVVTFSDVTAMKRRDEEHAKLASIVGSSENAIIGMSLDGIITSWNPGGETTYGYRADEVIGKSLDPLFPDRNGGEATRILEEIRAGRRVGSYETQGLRKDGTRVQLSVSVSPICDATGRVIAGSTIARNVTERNRAETELFATQQRLRAIMEALPLGVAFSKDTECREIEGNPMLMALFGAGPQDNLSASAPDPDAIGRKVRYFSGGRELSDSELPLQRAVAGRTPIPAEEIEVQLPDGWRWLAEISGAPIRDQMGKVIGGFAVVADITERKRAEQELLNADQRKNEFLAVLGHELRNPLAPIRNAAYVLSRQEGLPDQVRWTVDLIGRQSEQLERLVYDLLDVARITGGRIQLRMSPVPIQDALEDALQSVAPLVAKCGQSLQTWLPDAPIVVMADPVRLAQIFTNLLHNAAKYTPNGGHIQVTLERDGQEAVVRVRDDGVGIQPEDLPRLFDFFSRGNTEHPEIKDTDGLGVGLALAKQLTEKHKGTLKGHSGGPGKGSEFVVSLPMSSQLGPPTPADEPKADTAANSPARRILVVDDNPDVADSFRVLLEIMGHQVRALNAGRKVLAAIREFNPDVVFLDIGMPDMDGYQIAATIRSECRDPRPFLVALTGYGQDSDRKAALEAGFDRHMLKPLGPQDIETLLADLR